MLSVIERVERGATLLDEHVPGWYARVDLATLDVAHPCACVLGQLFGNYYAAAALNLVDHDTLVAVSHGFDVRLYRRNSQPTHATQAELDAEIGALEAAWIAAIAERRQ